MADFNELMAEVIVAGGDRVAVIEAFIARVEGLRDFDLVWALFAEARGLVVGRLYDRMVWERSKGVAQTLAGAFETRLSAPYIDRVDAGDGSSPALESHVALVASPVEDEDGGSKTHLKTRLPVAAPSSVPPVVRAAAKTLVRHGLETRGAESAGRAMRRLAGGGVCAKDRAEGSVMPYLPPDVPVRYSRGLSVFLIAMCALTAAIMAAVGSID